MTEANGKVRTTYPRLGGLRLHVRDVGEGPVVLLVNGLGAATPMWRHLEAKLVGRRVLSFDAPGTGQSQTSPVPVAIPTLAWLATKVLDHAGVDRADVLGYSMGGIVAQQLAAQDPDRVRRLVLVGTSVGLGTVPGTLGPMLNIATPLRYKYPWFYRRTIAGLAGGRARGDAAWVEAHGELRMRSTPSLLGYVSQVGAMTWTTLPVLSRITHPTLVVAGDDDPLVPPANAFLLTHRLPCARALILADEGHLMLMDDRSGAFAPIHDFLAADPVEASMAWQNGFVADDVALRSAIRGTRRQAQPWGVVGAALRGTFPARGPGT